MTDTKPKPTLQEIADRLTKMDEWFQKNPNHGLYGPREDQWLTLLHTYEQLADEQNTPTQKGMLDEHHIT